MFTYKEILGNNRIIVHMKQSIADDKVSHAYIFHGQAGLGKKLIAGTFAKSLQCMSGNTEPCNSCISCRTFESGNHPDVLYVKAAKTKALGVDDIREQISATIDIKPYRYPYKIYIIPKADTMTAAAQNALLKTIEEPPLYGVFMLLADNCEAFLHTIISRCIRFRLQPVFNEQVEAYLTSVMAVAPEKASFFSAYAQGNIGRAIALVNDKDFIALRESVMELARNIEEKAEKQDMVGLFAAAKELEKYKDNIYEVLDMLTLRYRDLLVDQERRKTRQHSNRTGKTSGANSDSGFHEGKTSEKILLNRLEALWLARRQLIQNGNFQMIMENLLLAFHMNVNEVGSILQRETGVYL